jgi:hypothetical protein
MCEPLSYYHCRTNDLLVSWNCLKIFLYYGIKSSPVERTFCQNGLYLIRVTSHAPLLIYVSIYASTPPIFTILDSNISKFSIPKPVFVTFPFDVHTFSLSFFKFSYPTPAVYTHISATCRTIPVHRTSLDRSTHLHYSYLYSQIINNLLLVYCRCGV